MGDLSCFSFSRGLLQKRVLRILGFAFTAEEVANWVTSIVHRQCRCERANCAKHRSECQTKSWDLDIEIHWLQAMLS